VIADQFSGAASDRIERLQTTDGTRVFQRGLTGEATDDVLIGTSAGEVLTAGAGSDVLVGGGAQDTLTGRAGADVFLFARPSDSLAEAASRDTITDFSQSEGNLIALSGIDAHTGVAGDTAFVFLGQEETAGAGTLGYRFSGGNTLELRRH